MPSRSRSYATLYRHMKTRTCCCERACLLGSEQRLIFFMSLFACFQGGPGFPAPRVARAEGWWGCALKEFRVVMLDQRGTGRSSPITHRTLAEVLDETLFLLYFIFFDLFWDNNQATVFLFFQCFSSFLSSFVFSSFFSSFFLKSITTIQQTVEWRPILVQAPGAQRFYSTATKY